MSTNVEVARRLREERKRLGLSQEELAERLRCSKTTQSNYERAERSPDAAYLGRAGEIGVDVLYVLTGNRQRASAAAHMRPHPGGAVSTGALDD